VTPEERKAVELTARLAYSRNVPREVRIAFRAAVVEFGHALVSQGSWRSSRMFRCVKCGDAAPGFHLLEFLSVCQKK
jgi:hypothetical protein